MADKNFKPELDQLAKDLAELLKLGLNDVRPVLVNAGPLVARWYAEAAAFDAAGETARADKKRQSIKHLVKNGPILDLATRGVQITNKTERTILAVFDKVLAKAV